MKNMDIRSAILLSGVKHYEIAYALGVTEFTLCRWLRQELLPERKSLIIAAIGKISKERGETR